MGVTWIEPVDITPTVSGSWVDVDCSPYLPTGTTGVTLHFTENTTAAPKVAFRKNGSTDERYTHFAGSRTCHLWAAIGCDDSCIIELKIQDVSTVRVYLVAGFGSEAVFFTNGINKRPSQHLTWEDVDISSETGGDTAIAAIFEFGSNSSSLNMNFGLRKNGSTDNRTYYAPNHGGAIIGVDDNEVCEAYQRFSDITGAYLYLVGYVTSGATFLTNATDLSLTQTNQWLDLSPLPSGASGGFVEVHGLTGYDYGLRKDGSSESIIYNHCGHVWGIVEAGSQVIEGYIANTAVDFFLVGYPISGAVHQGTAQLSGASQIVGGGLCAHVAVATLLSGSALFGHAPCTRSAAASLPASAALVGVALAACPAAARLQASALLCASPLTPYLGKVLFTNVTPQLRFGPASHRTDFCPGLEALAFSDASAHTTFTNQSPQILWDSEVN